MPEYDVVVVGAGHAGAQLAIELVTAEFSGRIALITSEDHEPYEKPPLTKGYLHGTVKVEDLALRASAFWRRPGLDLIRNTTITKVDPETKSVVTADGATYRYGCLVWAAGGGARRLPVLGTDLDGVYQLRTLDDAIRYKAAMKRSTNAVIVGGGFIGLEAAAAFAAAGPTLTVVESQKRVLARVACEAVSMFFAEHHRREGVTIILNSQVEEVVGHGRSVSGVRLSSGVVLEADTLLLAVGLVPNVEPLARAGATCSNGVEVDRFARTSIPDVYAVGDCAMFPYDQVPAGHLRLESLQNAVEHARVAARHILGQPEPYSVLPWFWSTQYDLKFKAVGIASDYDRVVVRGDVSAGRFSAVYLRGGAVCAVDSVNQMKDYVDAHTVVGQMVSLDLLADDNLRLSDCVLTSRSTCGPGSRPPIAGRDNQQ